MRSDHCTVACSVVVEFEVCLECGARVSEASNVKTWPQANTILHPYDASSRTSGDSGAHLRRSERPTPGGWKRDLEAGRRGSAI